jgi:hypothetical protein
MAARASSRPAEENCVTRALPAKILVERPNISRREIRFPERVDSIVFIPPIWRIQHFSIKLLFDLLVLSNTGAFCPKTLRLQKDRKKALISFPNSPSNQGLDGKPEPVPSNEMYAGVAVSNHKAIDADLRRSGIDFYENGALRSRLEAGKPDISSAKARPL